MWCIIGDLSSEHLSQYADVRRFNELDNIKRKIALSDWKWL